MSTPRVDMPAAGTRDNALLMLVVSRPPVISLLRTSDSKPEYLAALRARNRPLAPLIHHAKGFPAQMAEMPMLRQSEELAPCQVLFGYNL